MPSIKLHENLSVGSWVVSLLKQIWRCSSCCPHFVDIPKNEYNMMLCKMFVWIRNCHSRDCQDRKWVTVVSQVRFVLYLIWHLVHRSAIFCCIWGGNATWLQKVKLTFKYMISNMLMGSISCKIIGAKGEL